MSLTCPFSVPGSVRSQSPMRVTVEMYLSAITLGSLFVLYTSIHNTNTVNICSLYIISVLTTTEVCYNVVLG